MQRGVGARRVWYGTRVTRRATQRRVERARKKGEGAEERRGRGVRVESGGRRARGEEERRLERRGSDVCRGEEIARVDMGKRARVKERGRTTRAAGEGKIDGR